MNFKFDMMVNVDLEGKSEMAGTPPEEDEQGCHLGSEMVLPQVVFSDQFAHSGDSTGYFMASGEDGAGLGSGYGSGGYMAFDSPTALAPDMR